MTAREDDMLVLYILVRTDLPSMGYGKGAAQAAHAANHFAWHVNRDGIIGELAQKWHAEGNGFGTTITLATTIDRLNSVVNIINSTRSLNAPIRTGKVVDPSYPFLVDNEVVPLLNEQLLTAPTVTLKYGNSLCFRSETTCAYVFGYKSDLKEWLSDFNLLTNGFPQEG